MSRVAVVGAGTMGNGIAHVFAQHGWDTTLIDVAPGLLERVLAVIRTNLERQVKKGSVTAEQRDAALARIRTSMSLDSVADAQLVVEAATEQPDVKFKIFRDIDRLAPPAAILASNTSSISITAIAAQTKRPAQVIGMHFMNPVPVMPLVEVVRGNRVHEMHPDHLRGALSLGGDSGDGDGGGIAREDRGGWGQPIDVVEDFELDVGLLGRRLDHQLGIRHRVEAHRGSDPRQRRVALLRGDRSFLHLPLEVRPDDRQHSLEQTGRDVDQRGVPAVLGEHMRDAVPHRAGAHYRHPAHAANETRALTGAPARDAWSPAAAAPR